MSLSARIREDARLIVALNKRRSALDVAKRLAEGVSVRSAQGLEADGVQLALTGFRDDALAHFAAARELASHLLDTQGESLSSTAEAELDTYLAARIASTSSWATGFDRVLLLRRSIEILEKALVGEEGESRRAVATLLMQRSQLGQWQEALTFGGPKPLIRSTEPWSKLHALLYQLAHAHVAQDEKLTLVATASFDKWFRQITDWRTLGRLYHGDFTADDIVSLADVSARARGLTLDFWEAIEPISLPCDE